MSEIFTNMGFPNPPLTTVPAQSTPVDTAIESKAVATQNIKETPNDEFVSQDKDTKQKKKGLFSTLRTFISDFKKGITNISEYSKGLAKGIKDGVVFGSIAYTGVSVKHAFDMHTMKKAAERAGEAIPQFTKSKLALPITVAVVSAAIIKNLWNASLSANRKKSDIHHTYIGH